MVHDTNTPVRKNKKAFVPLLIIAAIFALSGMVMLLWNAVLPDVVPVTTITYWQAMGLLVLCKILFGGFWSGGSRKRAPFNNLHDVNKRWKNMSDEDKMRFKGEWKRRCEGRRTNSDNE
jgi:hypothetical protein